MMLCPHSGWCTSATAAAAAAAGVLLHDIFPDFLVSLLLFLIICYTANRTFRKVMAAMKNGDGMGACNK